MNLLLYADAAKPAEITSADYIFIVGLLIIGLLATNWIRQTLAAGREPVAFRPQRLVPWAGWHTIFAALIYLLALTFVAPLIGQVLYLAQGGKGSLFKVAEDDAAGQLTAAISVYQGFAVASFLGFFSINFELKRRAGATSQDLGIRNDQWLRDWRLGLIGFVVIVPPVYVLQAILNAVWMKTKHPILTDLKTTDSAALWFWATTAAVLVAPIVEEFVFRGVIQGWLQRKMAKLPPDCATPNGSHDDDAPQSLETASAASSLNADAAKLASAKSIGATPIVLSAALFALVHWEHGPDPIPIFFLGLGLGYLYRQTHSIWPGVVVHMLMNGGSMLLLALFRDQM